MSILVLLSELLLTGASLPILLLAAGWLAYKRYRPVLGQLLLVANTLLLVGAGLFLLTAYQLLAPLCQGTEYEYYVVLNRLTGPYWVAYWGPVLCKGVLPQVLWLKKIRRRVGAGLVFMPLLLADYWLPALYAALHRDYLPSSWLMLRPDYRGLALAGAGYLVVLAAGWLLVRARFPKLRNPRW